MKFLLTGSSGLIGSALTQNLEASGHEVRRLVRQPSGRGTAFVWNPSATAVDVRAFDGVRAVVHLAGESIAQRWTAAARKRIVESRVASTRLLVTTLNTLPSPPNVLISASGVGFYGDRGDRELDESAPAGEGFLADLAGQWERATESAAAHGIRVVNLRLGVVLSAHGGALAQMLPPFRLGLGGPVGAGRQFMSWITLPDAVAAIRFVMEQATLQGPVNVTAPHPVTNREFTRALARVLHRPAILPLPAFVVRLLFGQMGQELLLGSTRAVPSRLLAAGFQFKSPDIAGALQQILTRPR